jgi:hypothetical protein
VDFEDRHLPVLAPRNARAIDRPGPAALPEPLVAAAGGFLVGVATFVVLRVLRGPRRSAARLARRRSKRDKALDIAGTRSFLVDVHLLKR